MLQAWLKILIVDDSPEDRELYRRYLLRDRDYSYTFVEATLGKEALALWQQHQPDAVLLDYRLPDLDGLEFLAQLKSSTQLPYLPVIMVTGQGNEAIAVQAMKAGAQDYIVKKQITPERLQLAVQEAIETVQLRTQMQQQHELLERKRSDEALQESELRFRQLAENIDAVFWIREVWDNRVSYVSPAYKRLWGLNLEELYVDQYNWMNLIHPEDKPLIDKAFHEKAIADQFDEEYRIILPNGSIRWVRDRCFGLKDETGKIYRFTGIAEDITTRKQSELNKQFLNQLELRLRYLQDAQTMMWETVSSLGKYLEVNRCTLGKVDWQQGIYTAEQEWCRDVATNAGTYQLSDFATPEFQAAFAANQAAVVHDIITDTRTVAFAQNYATAQVKAFVGVPCIYQGQLVAILTIFSKTPRVWSADEIILLQETIARIWSLIEQTRAMLALRESEERYRCLAELIPQLVWTADGEGTLLDVNQRWTDFTGLTLEQAHTLGWEQVVHPDDIPVLAQQWAAAARQGISYQAEGRMRRADGVYRWYLHQAIPQKDEQGQIIKWFGTATDIEAQKQIEVERDRLLQQEQTARAEAERANQIKDEFLAILSHELRSPLNPILGWAKLLRTRKFDPAKTAEALITIERNANLQCQLIDDLLDVAKILRGKLSLNEAPVNLVFVIEAALDTVKTAALAKSISLHSALTQIGQVLGDSARLQQIVWNLLSNAIKFTPAGGRVDIRLERADNQAQITISDTGKGINPDFLPYIFETFRQEDTSTTRKYGGLGLGLAIAQHLVEAHGGTIHADSPGEDQGATFTVKLPLLDTKLHKSQPQELPTPELDLIGIKVLIVDDELDARELLTAVLTHYGAEVLAVTCAAEVLASLESFQPHVLVSDIGMPDMDGYALLQQIRSLPAEKGGQIGAIALSAYARVEDQQRSLTVGFQYHISKPLDLERLVQIVSELAQHT